MEEEEEDGGAGGRLEACMGVGREASEVEVKGIPDGCGGVGSSGLPAAASGVGKSPAPPPDVTAVGSDAKGTARGSDGGAAFSLPMGATDALLSAILGATLDVCMGGAMGAGREEEGAFEGAEVTAA